VDCLSCRKDFLNFTKQVLSGQFLSIFTMTITTPTMSPPATIAPDDHDDDEHGDQDLSSAVLRDLSRVLTQREPSSLFDQTATAVPVAAIKVLLGVVQRSKAETMMGLQDELKQAAVLIQQQNEHSQVALQSGCQLFLKYITRTFLELPNFEECRQAILERGERLQMMSATARDRIAVQGADFIQTGSTVLTTGWSRVVAAVLWEAAHNQGKHFDLIVLEGRPDCSGAKAAQMYADCTNIPVTVVLDAAMMYCMERVDLVLTGAEGVVENGGVVNKLGTAALAACASAQGKPFYVAAESYKFARLYPFSQRDLPDYQASAVSFDFYDTTTSTTESASGKSGEAGDDAPRKIAMSKSIKVENPPVDFTPAKFITLLFTDLGVLTPSAVSDELIRLYQ
jgi:translation initiation factor eIF-2B subunit alpha